MTSFESIIYAAYRKSHEADIDITVSMRELLTGVNYERMHEQYSLEWWELFPLNVVSYIIPHSLVGADFQPHISRFSVAIDTI